MDMRGLNTSQNKKLKQEKEVLGIGNKDQQSIITLSIASGLFIHELRVS